MDFEIDPTNNKRLMFLRYIITFANKISRQDSGDRAILVPITIGAEHGINLETIQSVLTHLRELEHIEINIEPNHKLSKATRLRRDDEEDYYDITLNQSFHDYYQAIETAASFFMAGQAILPGDGVQATLTFENFSTPVVTTRYSTYRLSTTMRTGVPYTIISYCLEQIPGQTIGIEQLKSELKAANLDAAGINNFRDNLRNSIFGKNKPLSPFITASPKSIQVRPTVLLNEDQMNTIVTAAAQDTIRNKSE